MVIWLKNQGKFRYRAFQLRPELREARKLLGGCPTGEAKATPAFAHRNTAHIVHAVGPAYRVNRLKQGFDDSDPRAGPY